VSGTGTLVGLDAIRAAAARIAGVAKRTPLVEVAGPSGNAPSGAVRTLALKCENLQPVGAFKVRGAYNMIARLDPAARARGVVTYSSGNHGQAVAYAARQVGIPAVIVMPTTAPDVKVRGARALGAEVLFEGTTTLHRQARAEREQSARGLVMVPPFDHEWIIEGQGTIGLEIIEQLPDVGTVVVPVGGGGMIAGVAAAVKALKPDTRVVGVEPAGAPKMSASLAAGHPVTLEQVRSIADGLLAVRPGDLTFAHVQRLVDQIVQVDDGAIARATVWSFERARLVVEPSGAVTVAAVIEGLVTGPAPIVAVLSGGNVAIDTLARLSQELAR
jgi:threonine dehydratase